MDNNLSTVSLCLLYGTQYQGVDNACLIFLHAVIHTVPGAWQKGIPR